MVKLLVIASVAWPALLASVVWQKAMSGESVFTAIAHFAASHICHQRPERSFHTAGVQWPVCGRCSGLYLGAPIGGALALAGLRRRGRRRRDIRVVVAAAALPTALTLAIEWLGIAPVSNEARFVAALPLGAAILSAMLHAVAPARRGERSFSID